MEHKNCKLEGLKINGLLKKYYLWKVSKTILGWNTEMEHGIVVAEKRNFGVACEFKVSTGQYTITYHKKYKADNGEYKWYYEKYKIVHDPNEKMTRKLGLSFDRHGIYPAFFRK